MAVLIRFLLALLLAVPVAGAETLQLQEQEIKAGLLYNFLKYTDWPQGAIGRALTVCVLGDDPFGGYLAPMNGRTVNQRAIALRSIRAAAEAVECQLLFVNGAGQSRWPQLRKVLAGRSVLTVGNFAGFAASGGMIEFGHADSHVSADLNADAVAAGGLHMQERLLRLVSVVHAP